MTNLFEIIIQIMMAYFQIVMIFFGTIFITFSLFALLDYFKDIKRKRHWFTSTVVSIREGEGMADENGVKGKQYYPVFEGVGLNGKTQIFECKTASTDINHYKIGGRFQVSIDEKNSNFVTLPNDEKNSFIIGLVLFVLGGIMVSLPIIFIPFTKLGFAVWAITAIVAVIKFSKYIKPKNMRETVAQFRERRKIEDITMHRSKPIVTPDYIQEKNAEFEFARSIMNKVTLVFGFIILFLGGFGYNGQLDFIDNAIFEKVGPCGESLEEECNRHIIFQDILSIIPLEYRPEIQGIYKSKYNHEEFIVSYGRWTSAPYLTIMFMGVLILFGAVRSNGRKNKI